MTNMVRWYPYREMANFRRVMSRMMDEAVNDSMGMDEPYRWDLALDVSEKAEGYVVEASLPGVKAEDLEITYDKNVLTIQGETKRSEQSEEKGYLLRERRYGRFTRSITLPTTIDANTIQASFEDGVLTLVLPKSEEVKPRRIEIKKNEKVIEG